MVDRLIDMMIDEKMGYKDYREMADKVEEEDFKEMFKKISEEEHNHYKMIKEFLSRMIEE